MSQVVAIVLNYNYGRYLAECLESIERQTLTNVRIIVVDDASTDSSPGVIAAFSSRTHRDVDVVVKPTNRGPAHSYNLAVRRLRPDDDYVAFIDADDTWYPTKMAIQIEVLEHAGPDVVAVYSDVDERDNVGPLRPHPSLRLPPGRTLLDELIGVGGFIPLPAALIRASAMRSLEPLDEDLRVCDYPMWLQLARRGDALYHEHLVATIRVHGASMSHTEKLIADKLKILARSLQTSEERRLARLRGRRQLRLAIVHSQQIPMAAQYEYAVRARDPIALLLGPLTLLSWSIRAVVRWWRRFT